MPTLLSDSELEAMAARAFAAGATSEIAVSALELSALTAELIERRKLDTTRIVLTIGLGVAAIHERWALRSDRPWRFELTEPAEGKPEHGMPVFVSNSSSRDAAVAELVRARTATAAQQVVHTGTEMGDDRLRRIV